MIITVFNYLFYYNTFVPGGHTTEILRLLESLGSAYMPREYVIADTDAMSEEKILNFEKGKNGLNNTNTKVG